MGARPDKKNMIELFSSVDELHNNEGWTNMAKYGMIRKVVMEHTLEKSKFVWNFNPIFHREYDNLWVALV